MVPMSDQRDAVVEDILRRMDARENRVIHGPRGEILMRPLVDDRTLTYAKDGESYSIDPDQLMMRAARMLRDGWSLARIRVELDLITSGEHEVPLWVLEDAILRKGMPALTAAIARGDEPAESVTVLGYEFVDEDPVDATPEIVEHHDG